MVKDDKVDSAIIDPIKAKESILLVKNTIENYIKNKMGIPVGFENIIVSHLWKNRYRANVFVLVPNEGGLYTCRKISDSFFIRMNENGTVDSSEPKIVNKYIRSDSNEIKK